MRGSAPRGHIFGNALRFPQIPVVHPASRARRIFPRALRNQVPHIRHQHVTTEPRDQRVLAILAAPRPVSQGQADRSIRRRCADAGCAPPHRAMPAQGCARRRLRRVLRGSAGSVGRYRRCVRVALNPAITNRHPARPNAPPGSEGMAPNRKSKTRSNLPLWVVAARRSPCMCKRIGKHRSAWTRTWRFRNADR